MDETEEHELAKYSGSYFPGSPLIGAHANLSYHPDPELNTGQQKPNSSTGNGFREESKTVARWKDTSLGPPPRAQLEAAISRLTVTSSLYQHPTHRAPRPAAAISLQAQALAWGLYHLNSEPASLHQGRMGWLLSLVHKLLKEKFPWWYIDLVDFNSAVHRSGSIRDSRQKELRRAVDSENFINQR